jgi:CO/xanthine dehydrogenase Mo-binding subunit
VGNVTPSPLNPLGLKGVGEAGAIPVGAAIAQAIEDALDLPSKQLDLLDIPLSPQRLWGLCELISGSDQSRSVNEAFRCCGSF